MLSNLKEGGLIGYIIAAIIELVFCGSVIASVIVLALALTSGGSPSTGRKVVMILLLIVGPILSLVFGVVSTLFGWLTTLLFG